MTVWNIFIAHIIIHPFVHPYILFFGSFSLWNVLVFSYLNIGVWIAKLLLTSYSTQLVLIVLPLQLPDRL